MLKQIFTWFLAIETAMLEFFSNSFPRHTEETIFFADTLQNTPYL